MLSAMGQSPHNQLNANRHVIVLNSSNSPVHCVGGNENDILQCKRYISIQC